jgi:hypothetical protein
VEQSAEWMIEKGNRSSRRKPAAVTICPQQFPHEFTRARTQVAAVESRRLTTGTA